MLGGVIVFMVFIVQVVFRMIFKGGIFGGKHYNHPDLYLNNTIILFDAFLCCSAV